MPRFHFVIKRIFKIKNIIFRDIIRINQEMCRLIFSIIITTTTITLLNDTAYD